MFTQGLTDSVEFSNRRPTDRHMSIRDALKRNIRINRSMRRNIARTIGRD